MPSVGKASRAAAAAVAVAVAAAAAVGRRHLRPPCLDSKLQVAALCRLRQPEAARCPNQRVAAGVELRLARVALRALLRLVWVGRRQRQRRRCSGEGVALPWVPVEALVQCQALEASRRRLRPRRLMSPAEVAAGLLVPGVWLE